MFMWYDFCLNCVCYYFTLSFQTKTNKKAKLIYFKQKQIKTIHINTRRILMLNGFSQRYLLKENSCSNWFDIPETKSVAFTVLPYVHGIGKKIQRMFNELDIKVVLKPYNTIANYVPSPNNLVKEELSGLIYQVPCAKCNLIYIGQTKRSLKSRLTEHKHQRPDQPLLCGHSMTMD